MHYHRKLLRHLYVSQFLRFRQTEDSDLRQPHSDRQKRNYATQLSIQVCLRRSRRRYRSHGILVFSEHHSPDLYLNDTVHNSMFDMHHRDESIRQFFLRMVWGSGGRQLLRGSFGPPHRRQRSSPF